MKPVRIRVLGSLQLGGDRGPLRSGRLRRLLAVLLVHLGTVVSVDRLAQVLWEDGQRAEPTAALQTLVWRLREAVRAADCDGAARLLTRAPGYLLDVDGDQVDVVRFERLVRTAASQPPEWATALLEEALSLWRGSAYAEFADDEFAQTEAARLEELRLAAGSDWVDAAVTGPGTPSAGWLHSSRRTHSTSGLGRSSSARCTGSGGPLMRCRPSATTATCWPTSWASTPRRSYAISRRPFFGRTRNPTGLHRSPGHSDRSYYQRGTSGWS